MTQPRPPRASPLAGFSPGPTPTAAEAKEAWRARVRRLRRELVVAQGVHGRRLQAEAIAGAALAFLHARAGAVGGPASTGADLSGACVTAYEAMATEPPTDVLIARLRRHRVRVLVPETLPEGDLDWREVTGDLVAPGHSGLLGRDAIAAADVVFTPGLAVTTGGVRLGQGGGYYDRVLPRRRPGTPVVTVLHDHELIDAELPREEHDTAVDATLTAAGGVRSIG